MAELASKMNKISYLSQLKMQFAQLQVYLVEALDRYAADNTVLINTISIKQLLKSCFENALTMLSTNILPIINADLFDNLDETIIFFRKKIVEFSSQIKAIKDNNSATIEADKIIAEKILKIIVTKLNGCLSKNIKQQPEQDKIWRSGKAYVEQKIRRQEPHVKTAVDKLLADIKVLVTNHYADENFDIEHESKTKPTCFISYAWPLLEEYPEESWTQRFIYHFANDLRAAGMNVKMDLTHSKLGHDSVEFMTKEIKDSDYIILIGSRSLYAKCTQTKYFGCAVYNEVQLIKNRIRDNRQSQNVPDNEFVLILTGDIDSSIPQDFKRRVVNESFNGTSYLKIIEAVLAKLYKFHKTDDPINYYQKLWEAFKKDSLIQSVYKGLDDNAIQLYYEHWLDKKSKNSTQHKQHVLTVLNEIIKLGNNSVAMVTPYDQAKDNYLQVINLKPKFFIPALIYQEVPGDGHCLFRAVAYYTNDGDYTLLRKIVAAHIEHNLEKFKEFINLPSGQTIEHYLQSLREGNEWADNIEIEVLMRVLDRPIIIIGVNGEIRNMQDKERFSGEPIFVYYNGHTHYDIFLRKENYSIEDVFKQLVELSNDEDNRESDETKNDKNLKMNFNKINNLLLGNLPATNNKNILNLQLHEAVRLGDINLVENLLIIGAEVNNRDIQNECATPLHFAVLKNNLEMVKLLVKHRAALEAKTTNGSAPLHVACNMGHVKIAEYLLNCGADINVETTAGATPLFFAIDKNNNHIVKLLLDYHIKHSRKINFEIKSGVRQATVLHSAVSNGDLILSNQLLKLGADPLAETFDGHTPLHMVASTGCLPIAELLINNIATNLKDKLINARASDQSTPLHWAAQNGCNEIVEVLIAHGAEINAQTILGVTTIQIATMNGHTETAELIEGMLLSLELTKQNRPIL